MRFGSTRAFSCALLALWLMLPALAGAQNITAFSGGGQRATVGTAFAVPFVAVVTDAVGAPVPGAQVNFTGTGLDAAYNDAGQTWVSAVTDAAGRASAVLHAGAGAGGYTVTAFIVPSIMASFGARQGNLASCLANTAVTSAADAGAGTLREAVDEVCNGGTIDIALACGSTIVLATRIYLSSDVTISGPGACMTPVAISGGDATRIFFVQSGNVTLQNLTLAHGYGTGGNAGNSGGAAGMGGAIFQNGGHLALVNVGLIANKVRGGGYDGSGSSGGGGFGGPSPDFVRGGSGGDLGGLGGTESQGGRGWHAGGDGAGGGAGSFFGGGADGGNGGFGGGAGYGVPTNYYGGTAGFGGGGAGGAPFKNSDGGWGGDKGTNLSNGAGAAAGFGGGIFVRRGLLDLTGVSFTGNEARGGQSNPNIVYVQHFGQGKGGALFVYDGAFVNASGLAYASNVAPDAGSPGIGNSAAPYTYGSTCPGTDTVDVCGALTAAKTLTVAVDGAGAVSSGPMAFNTINCPGLCTQFAGGTVALTATAASGYRFAGWTGACTGIGACNVSLASVDQAVTAHFSLGVSYDPNGATGGSVPVDNAAYAAGATVTVLGNTGSLVWPGREFTGWSPTPTGIAPLYGADATFAMGTSNAVLYARWKQVFLDIDGNHAYDPALDGLLLLRYLFGMTGTGLAQGLLGASPPRDATQITAWLDQFKPQFDVDDNGQVDALTDGVMILRYMLGLRNGALVTGALGAGANRADPAAIATYIGSLMQ